MHQRSRDSCGQIVTHALKDAHEHGDRIAVMEEGLITVSGTPDEILASKTNGFESSFFCGCDHGRKGNSGARDEMCPPTL
ncbi:hypothetical protein L0665_06445 [Methanogenium marinum]|uniref:Uncharacterized protein n=1 Tax=Methanogenium marinum TaxID=348610 RepID=A0A9Q4PYM6_9EURY|nr:hypothetical protein [Methanogenium marinum]MDE4908247.1 hypothetical protein [Methanogenium marinum]